MITFLVILLLVIYIIKSSTPNRKDDTQVEEAIDTIPPLIIKGRILGKLECLLCNTSELVDIFKYEDGVVSITMKNGEQYSSHLKDMTVAITYIIQMRNYAYEITFNNRKVRFWKTDIFTNEEWNEIDNILIMAKTVYDGR
ncbi:MAG: hypothetical protein IJX41_05370 [Bacteroidaceae bacterium]|nr:hypothetical protein [Bacteroidaceae bacterium]